MVDKPQQAHGGEGAKIGQVLRTVFLKSCNEAAAELLLYEGRVRHVVFTAANRRVDIRLVRVYGY